MESKAKEMKQEPVAHRVVMPTDHTLLSSFSIPELQQFCKLKNVDFTNLHDKKEYVTALAATYPKKKEERKVVQRITELQWQIEGIKHQKDIDLVIVSETDAMFLTLLKKLGVSPQLHETLMNSHNTHEKLTHLRQAVSVLDDHPHYTKEDEEMVTYFNSERHTDSLRLLTCKYRILNSNEAWMRSFCASGGISVLVETMDNRLEKDPMSEVDAAGLLQLLLCMRHIMKTDGLHVAVDTRGAVDVFVMSLKFEYKPLALEALELLSVVASFGGDLAVWQVVHGLNHLARMRNEKPFEVLVDAMTTGDAEVQAAVLELVNAIMMHENDIARRIDLRCQLQALGFEQIYNGIMAGFNRSAHSTEAPRFDRLQSIQDVASRRSSLLQQGTNKPKKMRLRAGITVTEKDICEGIAEDGVSRVHPEIGVMCGFALEAKKSKEGVKRRWYVLKDCVFSWWTPEDKDIAPPNGSQSMSSVVEILDYSTAANVQALMQHSFLIACADGKKYQLGVSDDVTKQKWVVALTAAQIEATMQRTAYRIDAPELTQQAIHKAQQSFEKNITVYELVAAEDKQAVLCSRGKIFSDPLEYATFLKLEYLVAGKEERLISLLRELSSLPTSEDKTIELMEATIRFVREKSGKDDPKRRRKKSADAEDSIGVAPSADEFQRSRSNSGAETPAKEIASNGIEIEQLKTENDSLRAQLELLKTKEDKPASTSAVDVASESQSPKGKSMSPVQAPEAQTPGTEDRPSRPDVGGVASLFAGRGAGGGRGGRGSGRAAGGLAALFAGRGAGPSAANVPLASQAKEVLRRAVIKSDKAIPPPPPLPGTAVAAPPPVPGIARGGSMNFSTAAMTVNAAKNKVVPKMKMKALFWTKLKATETANTVWEQIREPDLKWNELEAMFGEEASDKSKKGEKKDVFESVNKLNKPKFVSLFDAKRTQNVAIACGKLRKAPDDIAAMIIDLDPKMLNREVTETLLTLIPTPEERAAVTAYSGPISELDTPGKLFKALANIPRLEQRLLAHRTTLNWEDEAKACLRDIKIWSNAVDELRDKDCDAALKNILSAILAAGNYMNGGTARGQAVGVKLETLVKLGNIKQVAKGKGTLLHFIIDQLAASTPEAHIFYEKWDAMWNAAKVSSVTVDMSMKQLESALTLVKTELRECDNISDEAVRRPLRDRLSAFVTKTEKRYNDVSATHKDAMSKVQSARRYLGDGVSDKTSSSEDAVQAFFALLQEFATMYKAALAELAEWKEQAEKAAKRNQELEERRLSLRTDSASLADGDAKNATGGTAGGPKNVFEQFRERQEQTSDELVAMFKNRMANMRRAMSDEIHDDDGDDSGDEW